MVKKEYYTIKNLRQIIFIIIIFMVIGLMIVAKPYLRKNNYNIVKNRLNRIKIYTDYIQNID